MKKFVVVDSIGSWCYENGRKVVDCTVKESKLIAESNIATELAPLVSPVTEYRDDGTWHSLSIMNRTQARYYCR